MEQVLLVQPRLNHKIRTVEFQDSLQTNGVCKGVGSGSLVSSRSPKGECVSSTATSTPCCRTMLPHLASVPFHGWPYRLWPQNDLSSSTANNDRQIRHPTSTLVRTTRNQIPIWQPQCLPTIAFHSFS